MAYTKTNWVDYPNLSTPINAARLNNMEAGIAAAIQPGLGMIVDADVAVNAAIQYMKLNLAASIMNGDISPAAAIAISKLAGYTGNVTDLLHGDGSWSAAAGTGQQLDFVQLAADSAGTTATTEAAAGVLITGNNVTYDGSRVRIEFAIQLMNTTATGSTPTFVLLRDAVVLGQIKQATGIISGAITFYVYFAFDTPPAGPHQYKLAVFGTNSGGTLAAKGSAGGSGNLLGSLLRVAKA